MELKFHHQLTILLPIGFLIVVSLIDIEATSLFNPNSWATICVAFGASILTVVGIVTSVITSNENERRSEFIDVQNNIKRVLEEKIRTKKGITLDWDYERSLQKIDKLIDERSLMKHSESFIGFASFFSFLISVISTIYGLHFKFALGSFLVGIALIISYIVYCGEEFWKIDQFNSKPTKKGVLEIKSIKINSNQDKGDNLEILHTENKKEKVILLPEQIMDIEFEINFDGILRNGFLDSVVRYDDFSESRIPDRSTSLLDFGFADDYQLAIIGGEDTGILQGGGPIELSTKIVIRIEKGKSGNPFILKRTYPYVGLKDVYTYCSIPKGKRVDSITIRMFEDPYFRPNYKRRIVDSIKIKMRQVRPEVKIIPTIVEKILLDDDFQKYALNAPPPKPWEVSTKGNGRILVTNDVSGVNNTDRCMKIEHPKNSISYVKRHFEKSQKVIIKYYLRQENYGPRGLGSPFIIESPDSVKRENVDDIRAIYMDIFNGNLRHTLTPQKNIICKIDLKVWYLIRLEIDCLKHKYACTVINMDTNLVNQQIGIIPLGYNTVNTIRTKFFGKDTEWTTYIDGIKVTEMD